jgi:sterol desaturase/sphingolipid hydroxylase (fatty acid hydroxylase superfamily)
MGLPEGVDQQNLPFSKGLFESASAKREKRRPKKPDLTFSPWIKSRIFDALIIVGVWLVALWLASRVLGIGFFQLLTTSTVQTFVFLLILLVIYFFLFLFFLGETLGDHLFSEES